MIRSLAPAALLLPLLLSSAPEAQAQQSRMTAEEGWGEVARCAREESPRQRHECLDRVLGAAGLLTDEMRAQQQRRAFGLENPASVPSTAAPPTPAAPAPAAVPPPARASKPAPTLPAAAPDATPDAPASPDRLEVELASVQRVGNARLVLTTTEGAIWRQTESVDMPLPPSAGDRMSIRRGVAGGYRCTLAKTRLTFRCERSR